MTKRPVHRENIEHKKEVQSLPSEDFSDLFPVWSFACIDHDGKFGWGKCKKADWLEVLDKLKNFETMTYRNHVENGSHPVKVAQLSSEAKTRLQQIKFDDLDELFS